MKKIINFRLILSLLLVTTFDVFNERGGEKMKVYELKINLKLKKNLQFEQITEKTNYFIDYGLLQDQNLKDYHINRCYKSYVHDLLYPIEKDGLYKNGKIYTMRLRTIDEDLAKYFLSHLAFSETIELKGIGCEIRIIPQKVIKTLYTSGIFT